MKMLFLAMIITSVSLQKKRDLLDELNDDNDDDGNSSNANTNKRKGKKK